MLGITQGAVSKILHRPRETVILRSQHMKIILGWECSYKAATRLRPRFSMGGRQQIRGLSLSKNHLMKARKCWYLWLPTREGSCPDARSPQVLQTMEPWPLELASRTLAPLCFWRWVLLHSVLPWWSTTSAQEARRKTAGGLCKRNSWEQSH